MERHIQQLLKYALQRRFRLRLLLGAVCWLLLHMQLSIAAHHTLSPAPAGHTVFAASAQHEDPALCPTQSVVDDRPLCEKHCHPDNAPCVWKTLHPCLLPVDTTLLLVAQSDERLLPQNTGHITRITGPPAEIRFCRFRE